MAGDDEFVPWVETNPGVGPEATEALRVAYEDGRLLAACTAILEARLAGGEVPSVLDVVRVVDPIPKAHRVSCRNPRCDNLVGASSLRIGGKAWCSRTCLQATGLR